MESVLIDFEKSLNDLTDQRKANNKYFFKSFVDDDGTAYVWDASRRVFVPQEGGAAGGGAAGVALPSYDPEQMVFPGDDEPPLPVPPPRAAAEGLDAEEDAAEEDEAVAAAAAARAALDPAARARAEAVDRERARLKAKEEARAAAAAAKAADPTAPKVNTSVYVTGLPDDATAEEMATVFGRCGLIKEDDAGQPRVKLYTDKATGMLKGDGLVIYLKEPSVALACTILDGAQFRPGRGKPMSVTPAKFDIKVKSDGAKEPKKPKPAAGAAGGGGRKRKAGVDVDKALGWDGFDDVVDPRKVIVVLKHMFEPAEMEAGGPAAAEALRAEVVAECATFGAVDKARVFARNPEGVVTVRFREPDAADACRQRMHGRFFGGRALQAAMYDGRTDFEPPRRAETEEEQAARLERYAAELEKEFDDDA
jgi:HIV Tat-specific factor 1